MPIKNPLQVYEPEVDPGKWIKLDNWDVSLFLLEWAWGFSRKVEE